MIHLDSSLFLSLAIALIFVVPAVILFRGRGATEPELRVVTELRDAIEQEQFSLEYQPTVEMSSGRLMHIEALIRWNHPLRGRIAPDEFIPLAEHARLIGEITRWVLRAAIAQCAEWRRAGHDLKVAVNLSALDVQDASLPEVILSLLAERALPPSKLLIEITESAIMRDPALASRVVTELKRRGVLVAIDDFGTGYSSLAHLKRLRVDKLKIDRTFVVHLANPVKEDLVLMRAMIDLAHNMGLKAVAEGVENAAMWETLANLGCDVAQGFFISEPLSAAELRSWIDTWSNRHSRHPLHFAHFCA